MVHVQMWQPVPLSNFTIFLVLFVIYSPLLLKHVLPTVWKHAIIMTEIHSSTLEKNAQGLD